MRLRANIDARFHSRPNRFVVVVRDARGRKFQCYCANPGRMRELLLPGAAMRVTPATTLRTSHRALLVRQARTWVGLDTSLASPVFAEGVQAGLVAGISGPLVREVVVPGARLDFGIRHGGRGAGQSWRGFIEVKCASLVEDGTALFPDAPSDRAVRHCRALARLARQGREATLAFVIVRPDAERLVPNTATHPALAKAMASAARAGVALRAFRCATSTREVRLLDEVPVELPLRAPRIQPGTLKPRRPLTRPSRRVEPGTQRGGAKAPFEGLEPGARRGGRNAARGVPP